MRNNSTIIKIPDFVEPIIFPFVVKEEFSSAKYVSGLREEIGGRYKEEIGEALDKLFKNPKKKWPKLLKRY